MLEILQHQPAEKVMIDLDNLPHNLVAMRVNSSLREMAKTHGEENLNEAHVMSAVQQAWKIAESTAENSEYILAILKEEIPGDSDHFSCRVVGVFKPRHYGFFTPTGQDDEKSKRRSFLGEPAEPDVKNLYLNKYLPDIVKVDANPVRVFNKKI